MKMLAVGINYPSLGCGRVSQHISFADKLSKNEVGAVREYSIRAVQDINGTVVATGYTTMPYRIPFLVKVSGTVKTQAGVGVQNVKVAYCHVDPDTAEMDTDTNYCPLQTFVTNKLGQFTGEIRVSNVKWDNVIEYFNVSVGLNETMGDGTVVEHVFSPPFQIMPLTHMMVSPVAFTDNTTVAIFGSVVFDPKLVDSNNCPFAGVPVNLVTSNGDVTSTTSDTDGTFSFSVTRGDKVTVYIPEYNNYTWDSNVISLAGNMQAASTTSRRLSVSDMNMLMMERDRDHDLTPEASVTSRRLQVASKIYLTFCPLSSNPLMSAFLSLQVVDPCISALTRTSTSRATTHLRAHTSSPLSPRLSRRARPLLLVVVLHTKIIPPRRRTP